LLKQVNIQAPGELSSRSIEGATIPNGAIRCAHWELAGLRGSTVWTRLKDGTVAPGDRFVSVLVIVNT